MRIKQLPVLAFLFISLYSFSQEKIIKKISHTTFFKMIADEKSDIFELKDAFITFDKETDSIFSYEAIGSEISFKASEKVVINKTIELDNVHFEHKKDDYGQGIPFVTFNGDVRIYNTSSILFFQCVFNGEFEIDTSIFGNKDIDFFDKTYDEYEPDIVFYENTFSNNIFADIGSIENYSSIGLNFLENTFTSSELPLAIEININNIRETIIEENKFNTNGYVNLFIDTSTYTSIYKNDFGDSKVSISKASLNNSQTYLVEENIFKNPFLLRIDQFNINHLYRWSQWENKVLSTDGYEMFISHLTKENLELDYEELYDNDSIRKVYQNNYKFELEKSYKFEMQLLGQFYDFYKLQHDVTYANKVYIELKNLETQRYAYLYKKDPSFSSYFTWKINQFLKIFSGYGTNPSLSIIFSLYVILFFAVIYMLFPNNWETGRKNKLMNRLQFFTKYFRQKEGIKEIYEEEKQEAVMSFNEFKKYMHSSKKEVPTFFLWLTKPIYYFSSYNYKMTGRILKHTDILKGRWVDLPKRRKIFTSFIMAFWIGSLIILDLLIKFLNALTLSINTFTTLGFGEIPIKGIPRYLAVVQGFIGWFMLTIFSVSLISQLLN